MTVGDDLPLAAPRPILVRRAWLPAVVVMAGSLVTILPAVAPAPLLPPFGLLLLLAWRLRRPDLVQPWAPALLGAFDDLVSGQPMGSAVLLWTVCTLSVDVLDSRLVSRDFRQDWLIAAGGASFCLAAGRLVASRLSAHVDSALLLQMVAAALLYPAIARLVVRLDAWRERP